MLMFNFHGTYNTSSSDSGSIFFIFFRFTATIFRIFVLTALLWTKRLQSIPDTYGIYILLFFAGSQPSASPTVSMLLRSPAF